MLRNPDRGEPGGDVDDRAAAALGAELACDGPQHPQRPNTFVSKSSRVSRSSVSSRSWVRSSAALLTRMSTPPRLGGRRDRALAQRGSVTLPARKRTRPRATRRARRRGAHRPRPATGDQHQRGALRVESAGDRLTDAVEAPVTIAVLPSRRFTRPTRRPGTPAACRRAARAPAPRSPAAARSEASRRQVAHEHATLAGSRSTTRSISRGSAARASALSSTPHSRPATRTSSTSGWEASAPSWRCSDGLQRRHALEQALVLDDLDVGEGDSAAGRVPGVGVAVAERSSLAPTTGPRADGRRRSRRRQAGSRS